MKKKRRASKKKSGGSSIAILGAGRVGSALARLWIDAGEDVQIIATAAFSNSSRQMPH